jgi:hypothetical protein
MMHKNRLTKSEIRVEEDADSLSAMIDLYCRDKHGTKEELCKDCISLRDYAVMLLERCIFLPQKPSCAKCPVHCYTPQRRQEIRQVMRYAAPRFYFFRPGLTLRHFWHTIQHPSKKVREVTERLKTKDSILSSASSARNKLD